MSSVLPRCVCDSHIHTYIHTLNKWEYRHMRGWSHNQPSGGRSRGFPAPACPFGERQCPILPTESESEYVLIGICQSAFLMPAMSAKEKTPNRKQLLRGSKSLRRLRAVSGEALGTKGRVSGFTRETEDCSGPRHASPHVKPLGVHASQTLPDPTVHNCRRGRRQTLSPSCSMRNSWEHNWTSDL